MFPRDFFAGEGGGEGKRGRGALCVIRRGHGEKSRGDAVNRAWRAQSGFQLWHVRIILVFVSLALKVEISYCHL